MSGYRPVKIAYIHIKPDSSSGPLLCPVIFIHGLMLLKEHWNDIPKKVANATNREVYAIDARNHGDSEWSDEHSFELLVLDLIHFMDVLGIPKAILVGHSMSGIASMNAALKHPERFEKIVIEDIGPKRLSETHLVQAQAIASALTYVIKAVDATPPEFGEAEAKQFIVQYIDSNLPEEVKKIIGEDKKREEDTLHLKRAKDGRWTHKANCRALLNFLEKEQRFVDECEAIYPGQAIFIYGTISPYKVQEQEDEIKKFFPSYKLIPIEDANHSVHTDKPEEFTEVLLKYLS